MCERPFDKLCEAVESVLAEERGWWEEQHRRPGPDGADAWLDERQRSTQEADLAARLRAQLHDRDTVMTAQGNHPAGRRPRPDILVGHTRQAVEAIYTARSGSSGQTNPGDLCRSVDGDWSWLTGRDERDDKGYARCLAIWWPRAATGFTTQGPGGGLPHAEGAWRLQECVSFTPDSRDDVRIARFAPFAGYVRLAELEPRIAFVTAPSIADRSVITVDGVGVECRIIGAPFADPFWASVYTSPPVSEGLEEAVVRTLARGYDRTP